MTSSTNTGREVNINVVVRARPMNSRELTQNARSAVRINHSTNIIEVTQQSRQQTKSYLFDKVFNEQTSQELFYKQVVSPVVRDFVEGFNCTLFAYGQTGTGKTYTMVGDQAHLTSDKKQKYLDFSIIPDAGVIPRVSDEVFKILDSQNADYQVRVSHMEVYCEEIYDLMKDSSGEREALKLFEEKQSYGMGNKGHRPDDARDPTGFLPQSAQSGDKAGGKLVILGLEEALVKSPSEIMALLLKSMENRRVAETKMNSNSSRSHSIFTICLIVKETAPSSNANVDVDVIRISKLNLVDLAGSESAGKSGASGDRQQEASKINKSLLTLGRVINALTETKQHIPYRESKLTRLLQDSLGGRTKTCIIATITTSDAALDETINTLDYMSRAKKIKNLPEVTTKISGKSVLKEYSLEIKRLRELLTAQKDAQGGIFLTVESYDEITEAARTNKAQIAELEARVQHAMNEMERLMVLFSAEERKVDKLKAALNKTVTKVAELHSEKLNLYEKIVRGRDREKSNMAAYAALRDQGGSSLLEQVFSPDSLRRTVDQSGIASAIVEVEKTASACKAELLLFSEALTQTLAEHKQDMTTGLEDLVRKLMTPIIQSSAEMLGTTIPDMLEKDLLGKLSTELKDHFLTQAGTSLAAMIVDPCTQFVGVMEKRLSALLGSFSSLSSLLDSSSKAMLRLFRELLSQFQDFAESETAFISGLSRFLTDSLDQQSQALTGHLKSLLEQACRETIASFSAKLEHSTGDLKGQLSSRCDIQLETLGTSATDFKNTVETRELPSVVASHESLRSQLQSLRSDISNALDLLKTHQEQAAAMTARYGACLEQAFNTDISGAIEAPINKSAKQLVQIGETLTDMRDAFSAQLSSISATSHTTLLDAVTQLAQTHVHDNIVDKLLGGASLDPAVKNSSAMASILSSDLERECGASTEPSMVVNMTMCSVADMVSRFEASVVSAFATLVSGFHLTPVIPAGTSTLETPALGTPNVRPIALAQTHTDFVYGVVTPSIPLSGSALTQHSAGAGAAEAQ